MLAAGTRAESALPSRDDPSAFGGKGCLFFGFVTSCRLKKRWEFDAVFRTGRKQRGELVRLYYLRTADVRDEPAKVGVTVGKRVANAVCRARGRRLLRESFRRLLPWMKEDIWAVASLREAALACSAQVVYLELATLLHRARLMKDEWPGLDWTVDSSCLRIFRQP